MVKRKRETKNLQYSTKYYTETKDWATQTPLILGQLSCSGNKGNNKITELRTILQRESQNS